MIIFTLLMVLDFVILNSKYCSVKEVTCITVFYGALRNFTMRWQHNHFFAIFTFTYFKGLSDRTCYIRASRHFFAPFTLMCIELT